MLFSPEVPLDGNGTVEAVMIRKRGTVVAGIRSTGRGTAPLYVQPGYLPAQPVEGKAVKVDPEGNLTVLEPGKHSVSWKA